MQLRRLKKDFEPIFGVQGVWLTYLNRLPRKHRRKLLITVFRVEKGEQRRLSRPFFRSLVNRKVEYCGEPYEFHRFFKLSPPNGSSLMIPWTLRDHARIRNL